MDIQDPSTFVDEYRRIQQRNASIWTQVLRKLDLVNPTPNSVIKFSRTRKWNEYLRLLLTFHYIPDESLQVLVRLELEARQRAYGRDKEVIARTLLRSEAEALMYLLESSLFRNPRALFGFIGQPVDWRRYQLYWFEPRKPKRPVRKSGYQDQGFRRPDHKWRPSHDWSLTELHYKIEMEKEAVKDSSEIILGGL
jgi:hypothetical protein